MAKIIIKSDIKKRTLRQDEVRLFLKEFSRVRRAGPQRINLARIAPDCSIHIISGRSTKTYHLYGQTILYDPRTKKKWSFYFGLLILRWLYS